jgi:hypothetical protein
VSPPPRAGLTLGPPAILTRCAGTKLFGQTSLGEDREVRLARLWDVAAARGQRLGLDEPEEIAIETRGGSVVFVRRGDRLAAVIAPRDVPVSVVRYDLNALLDR